MRYRQFVADQGFQMLRPFVVTLCLAMSVAFAGGASIAFAQPDGRTAAILQLRAAIVDAAARHDRAALATLLTDDFTHTHAIGRVDGKDARLTSLIGDDATIEKVAPTEIAVRFYGEETAVAVGRTQIGADAMRWTSIYVRQAGRWRLAASQASPIR